jgi:integrase/recombinase XerD
MSKTVVKKVPWSPDSWEVALRRRIERASAARQPALQAFADWLMEERGVGAQTTRQRVDSVATFLDAVIARAASPCQQALVSLSADAVEAFFVRYGKNHGKRTVQCMQTAMRLFLRFAALRGWVDRELAAAVPSLVRWRLSGLPRGLSTEELTKVLASPWPAGQCPRRNRAIVEMLATYGVRREQISALRLSDVDWRERTIDFAAHKGGKSIHHELSAAVAQSLAAYLREERPSSDCTYVFLRCRRPYLRLSPLAITSLVRARMVGCGLPARGPHALRHTFATRLLRAGQPIKAIADLLGHRSLSTIAIYAKVDVARLLEVAVDWPEVGS